MLLTVENLVTHFDLGDGRIARAVDGVSFDIAAGETLAIVGESGCGKSQTAFSIMRLIEQNGFHDPASRIWLNGDDLLKLPEEKMQHIRGNRIAMIFQEPMASLNPLYRVSSQLSEPLRQHQHLGRKEAYNRCIELLRHVGIPSPESRVDNYPHEMSGGMKQRVMIAMALACRPKLLIADEPTTALDVTIQAQILGLMKELQQETGMAIMLITHDMGVVNQMADSVCVMYAGKIVEKGSRQAIFQNSQHPYTRRLLASIPSRADKLYKLQTIPGRVPSASAFPLAGCRFAPRCRERIDGCDTETPAMLACGKHEGHIAACHLLRGKARDEARRETIMQELRPPREKAGEMLLTVDDLCVHFPVKRGLLQRVVDHVRAVDGVEFGLRRGETLALVGESGCGKTTVGHSILRLIDEARGHVQFDGMPVLELPRSGAKKLRMRMQLVFQDPFGSLSPRMKVSEIVGEGLLVHAPHLSPDARSANVDETLQLVGLSPDVGSRFPHEFSGGQRQRIALARALILEPDLLVLDEPTSALDVSVQAQILNLLEEIQRRRHLAYLFITHDLGVVEYIADYVAVMYLGRVVEYAPVDALFATPRHPYTRTLLDAVPRIDDHAQAFGRIAGDVPSPLHPPAGCHFHPRCPKAQAVCRVTYPPITETGAHRFACHFPLDEKRHAS